MSFRRDKIGDYEDWKDGHDAFRQNAISAIKELDERIRKLEEVLNEKAK
tara:strand:+ start:89 stop:235 length:147 start_codon:yes stop_codon:yes gene_type:complete